MDKLIIEAAINEATTKEQNPQVPYGPEEIAADAVACVRAGASIVHFHARDPATGEQRWIDAGLYAEAMRLIQQECDAVLYPTYSARLPLEERYSHFEALGNETGVTFEMATIDLGAVNMAAFDPTSHQLGRDFVYNNLHGDVMRFFELAKEIGVIYNLGIREPGHLRHALAYREMGLLREPLILKFFFTDNHPYGLPPTVRGLQAYLDMLPPGLPHVWFIQSYGASHTLMQSLAISLGGHVRTGIGDNPRLDGRPVTSVRHVEKFVGIANRFGREIASPADARAMLGLTS
ncbi:MAG: 3-keto-5-aminohexanoate cleavage protein [Dehalococcoidia bacterium]